ncbi:hypothetical protein ACRAWF_02490 [Streptomyces sp. L7]
MTRGHHLPARYVLHTVGPVTDGTPCHRRRGGAGRFLPGLPRPRRQSSTRSAPWPSAP